jgi:hypothetical protein
MWLLGPVPMAGGDTDHQAHHPGSPTRYHEEVGLFCALGSLFDFGGKARKVGRIAT